MRLQPAALRRLDRAAERLNALSKLHASANPDRPLQRGFARVARMDGSLVMNGALLAAGEEVAITFADTVRQAVIEGQPGENPTLAKRPAKKGKAPAPDQGDLF